MPLQISDSYKYVGNLSPPRYGFYEIVPTLRASLSIARRQRIIVWCLSLLWDIYTVPSYAIVLECSRRRLEFLWKCLFLLLCGTRKIV